MRKERVIKIIVFIFMILLLSISNSYAAMEIKDTTTATLTNKTISEFYDMAEEMKNPGQGLEGASVDVKMANNYDWAVVSYFSNSSYGTGGAGENTGVQIPDTTHYSTNGNITGVMDFGKTLTFTAGIIASYSTQTLTTAGGQSIIDVVNSEDAETRNRVDKFADVAANVEVSVAKTGWYNPSLNHTGGNGNYPYSIRKGLFGMSGGYGRSSWAKTAGDLETGMASNVTFRPVFYAQ